MKIKLFLFQLLFLLLVFDSTLLSSDKIAKEKKIVDENFEMQGVDIEHIELLKEYIKNNDASSHTSEDWRFSDIRAFEWYIDKKSFKCDSTLCAATMNHILNLFVDVTVPLLGEEYYKVYGNDDPYRCSFDLNRYIESNTDLTKIFHDTDIEFLKKKSEKEFKHKIAQDLFSYETTPKHLLFCVRIMHGGHYLLIEKRSDGLKTWWRIYHSFLRQFSCAQWLGIDPWHEDIDGYSTKPWQILSQKYGQGKALNQEGIISFMQNLEEAIVTPRYKTPDWQASGEALPLDVCMFESNKKLFFQKFGFLCSYCYKGGFTCFGNVFK